MRRIPASLATLALVTALAPTPAQSSSPHTLGPYAYVSPAPGSGLHLTTANVIIRPGGKIRASSLDPEAVVVTGSVSGTHGGNLRLSDDGETIVFRPDPTFLPGEAVTCAIAGGIEVEGRPILPPVTFSFRMVPLTPEPPPDPLQSLQAVAEELLADEGSGGGAPTIAPRPPMGAPSAGSATGSAGGLGIEPPPLSTAVYGPTAPGDLFLSDISFVDFAHRSHIMIVRNDGSVVFSRQLAGQGLDFKVQPDGRISFFDAHRRGYFVLDASYAEVDSFRCGNGYRTDQHELRLLANGHALLMSYDARRIDMSGVAGGGRADAIVTGLVIQELDRAKDVVFQWRSWDHFRVTDTTQSLTRAWLDYAHGNAIEQDRDGNLLISSRHMEEITKIDRGTGAVLWRWGGKNNQFTFVNDPDGFSHQHAVRRLANGNIILYDNGNLHDPPYSRAVEYALDEEARVATLVWQYREPGRFAGAMGYAQRLENGNTLISWGTSPTTATEVTPDGRKVFEASLPPPLYSYRVARHEWAARLPARVALEPQVLGASSQGAWVVASIESDAFDAGAILSGGIRLAGDLAPDPGWTVVEHGSERGRNALRIRFDRRPLLARLHPGVNEVEIAGPLRSGARFRERLSVRVVGAGGRSAAPRVVSAPGALPARLRPTARAPHHVLEVFDVRGRLVRRWRALSDERGEVLWDGRGRSGDRVPAGVYFLREARRPEGGAARLVITR